MTNPGEIALRLVRAAHDARRIAELVEPGS